MKKKSISKAQFLRDWGLPATFQYRSLRYKNPPEKGVYWYWFSRYIRARDVEMYGTCISCGRQITLETCDAGHFMPTKDCGRDLLFDELNVNAECKGCNGFDVTHLLGYAEGLDKRYGEGTSAQLRRRREQYLKSVTPIKDWKADDYAEMIRSLPSYPQNISD